MIEAFGTLLALAYLSLALAIPVVIAWKSRAVRQHWRLTHRKR